MTAEEFEEVAADLGPCELVRGQVIQLSPGGAEHSEITVNVSARLWQWSRQSKFGRVLSGKPGLVVKRDPDTVRGAEIAYLSYNRLPLGDEPEGFCTAPPELVVEVLDQGISWGKTLQKTGEYLVMGVDCVWVIDPKSHRLHVFRPEGEPAILTEGQTVSDENILPGFSCTVADFFSE